MDDGRNWEPTVCDGMFCDLCRFSGDLSYDCSNFSTSGVPSAGYCYNLGIRLCGVNNCYFCNSDCYNGCGDYWSGICRWFTAIKFKCSKESTKGFKTELKPESYWIKRLEEWKKSSIVLHICGLKLRKLVQFTKNLVLNLCIMVQVMIVVTSKLTLLMPFFFVRPLMSCYHYCYKLFKKLEYHSTSPVKSDICKSFLLLEGEEELTQSTLENISNAADCFIVKAKKQKPKNLIELLLQKSTSGFKSLPLVTLTCIAIAISKIKDIVDRLVHSVSDGLSYVRHVDETVDTKGNLTYSRDATDKVWLGVELDGKWLDEDLTRIAPKQTSCRETFQILADFAQKIVIKYKADINGSPDGNPTNWPINVVAANSMYRICKSLLLDDEGNNHQINHDELFVKLFDMIAGEPGHANQVYYTRLGIFWGKPIAACVIYKCLLHWRSFEVERTSVFDHIIQTIASSVEVQDNNDLAELMSQGLRSSPLSVGLSFLNGRVLGRLDDLRQAPRTSRASLVKGRSHAHAVAQQALIAHWQSIVKSLDNYSRMMKANFVSSPFPSTQSVHSDILIYQCSVIQQSSFVTRVLLIQYGEYVKSALAELEQWCGDATEEYAGSAWDELKHIRQAVGFLVIHQKPKKILNEITNELCPVLSIQQLYRISTMYWDDKYGAHTVFSDTRVEDVDKEEEEEEEEGEEEEEEDEEHSPELSLCRRRWRLFQV
ncbi:unnamed protein product [Camellia sinensis]